MRFIRIPGRNLLSKLLIAFLVLILIPTSVISTMSIIYSNRIINEQLVQSKENTISQIDMNVSTLIDQIIAIVNVYNINTELEPILLEPNNQSFGQIKVVEKVERNLFDITTAFGWGGFEIILLGLNGTIFSNDSALTDINMKGLSKYDWYAPLIESREKIRWISSHNSFYTSRRNDSKYFTAAKALDNKNSGLIYGVILLSVQESSLYNIYKNCLNTGNTILIADQQGSIISHSNREKTGGKIEINKLIKSPVISGISNSYITLDGEKYLSLVKRNEKTGWYIFDLTPASSISFNTRMLRTIILLTSVLCIVLSFITAVAISRRITVPLMELFKKIVRRHGRYNKKNDHLFENELDVLNMEYDGLINDLENTINSLIKEQENKRKAELQMLQMQINPHFLYNTLNSIKCLVWTRRMELIEPVVNALVSLLERTINRNDELIPIEEELDCIRNYILIQEIRISNVIKLNISIENSMKKYYIPKLLLQPLIENSIFHGIEPLNGDGTISVDFSSEGGDIRIEIVDNGVGVDEETIQKVLSDKQDMSRNRFSGIGVKNVDERLKMYFGSQYGLSIKSALGIGTSVVLTLPRIVES